MRVQVQAILAALTCVRFKIAAHHVMALSLCQPRGTCQPHQQIVIGNEPPARSIPDGGQEQFSDIFSQFFVRFVLAYWPSSRSNGADALTDQDNFLRAWWQR